MNPDGSPGSEVPIEEIVTLLTTKITEHLTRAVTALTNRDWDEIARETSIVHETAIALGGARVELMVKLTPREARKLRNLDPAATRRAASRLTTT